MLPDRLSRMLTAYVDGELNDDQRKVVLRLVRRSSEARDLLRRLQSDADCLRQLPRPVLGCDVSAQVLRILDGQKTNPTASKSVAPKARVPVVLGLAAAAAVLFVLGAGVYFVAMGLKEPPSQLAVQTGDLIASTDTPELDDPELPPTLETKRGGLSEQAGLGASVQPELLQHSKSPRVIAEEKPAPLPELLGAPQKDENSGVSKENSLGFPARPPVDFRSPAVHLTLNRLVRDLDLEKRRQEIEDELRKGEARRLDLTCKETAVGMERLQAAFKAQGIRLIVDPGAQAHINLRLKTDYALYVDSLSPRELLAILGDLRNEDRKAESKRRDSGQFERLVLNVMTPEDHQRLIKLLGQDPTELKPKPKAPTEIDIHKPLSEGTADRVIDTLKGQGSPPRPPPGQAGPKQPSQSAIAVDYNTGHSRSTSTDVKLFLENWKERRTGTVQMLLILRSIKN
ncbi:MAG TPA: hypothetical protein VK395_27340 [Gemmataceae bacterium]|nr:hypothetical protein [Gemmataceae bacterium]